MDGAGRLVAGVDGCRGGWVGAAWDGDDVEWRALPLAFGPMLAALADCAVVAVDVPIGLVESGYRACDVAARAALGARRSSVFLVPPRPVIEAPSHADACRVAAGSGEKGVSVQLWGIRDRVLDATGCRRPGVVEAHPELSFLHMTGAALPPKRSAAGLAARVAALAANGFGDVAALLAAAPRPARADDALDALACAWTARRVLAGTESRVGGWPEIVS